MRATSKRIFTRSVLSSNTGRVWRTSTLANNVRTIHRPIILNSAKYSSQAFAKATSSSFPLIGGLIVGIAASASIFYASAPNTTQADWNAIRNEIKAILEDPKYDDGSYAGTLVRLAWHASGTFSVHDKTGGSNGANMRFLPESGHGANAGLKVARDRLESVKQKHPEISYADLWTFAGVVAVEEAGGPKIPWRPGRTDNLDGKKAAPDGRLPDASLDRKHFRDIFYRMGFNDREIVALLGAHALGRCHTDRSGYKGPWTTSPTAFTNEYYVQLLEAKWTKKKWDGPLQYEDETGELMMLPIELELINDPEFRKYVELYAKDDEIFFKDFAAAFSKLLELGVVYPEAEPVSAPSSGGSFLSNLKKKILG